MIRHILIPTDFSPQSINACHYGVALAKDLGADVTIVHVCYHPSYIKGNIHGGTVAPLADSRLSEEDLQEEAHAMMKDLLGELKSIHGEKSLLQSCILKGLPTRQILQYAGEVQADLLVLGVKPRSKAYLLFFGSVAADVMKESVMPVLTIPPSATYRGIHRYVYACDFDKADGRALMLLDQLWRPLGVEEGICLHVMEESSEEKFVEEAQDIVDEIRSHVEKSISPSRLTIEVVGGEDPIQRLDHFLREKKVDLIALTTHRQGDFFRLFHPSMTQKVVFHIETPVFIFHA